MGGFVIGSLDRRRGVMPRVFLLHRRTRTLAVAGLIAMFSLVACTAEGAPGTVEGPAHRVFDRSTVDELLKGVEDARNRALLKYAYFGTHQQHVFPLLDGYHILAAAAERAPVSTPEWIQLESVRSYAAFRLGGDTRQEGYDAFRKLLQHAVEARRAGVQSVIEEAISDFVLTMLSPDGLAIQLGPEDARELVPAALETRLDLASAGEAENPLLPWAKLAIRSSTMPACTAIVDKALAAHQPHSFQFLMTVAELLSVEDKARALSLLKEAGPMAENQAPDEGARYYGMLAAASAAQESWADADRDQREVVRRTGSGYALLAWYSLQATDPASYEDAMRSLCSPTAAENDILQMAAILRQQSGPGGKIPPADARARLVVLWKNYLDQPRKRSPEVELRTRLNLARRYVEDGDRTAALAVIDKAPIPTDPSPLDQSLIARIRKLRAAIEGEPTERKQQRPEPVGVTAPCKVVFVDRLAVCCRHRSERTLRRSGKLLRRKNDEK